MNILALVLATAVMPPSFTVAPIPYETEKQAFDVARWEAKPECSRWVMNLGEQKKVGDKEVFVEAWTGGTREVSFHRPWCWRGRRTALRLDGVAGDLKVTVNGRAVGESKGVRGVVEFDLTDHLKWFGCNVLAFELPETKDGQPAVRRALLVSTAPDAPRQLRVKTWLSEDGLLGRFQVVDETGCVLKEREIKNPQLWSAELPVVCMTPMEHDSACWLIDGIEYRAVKFGFRKFEMKDGKPWLNGKPLVLKAVAPHRETPGFNGNSTETRALMRDAAVVKRLNANAVYASDYPRTPEWYEVCDRDGIYVLAAPGEDVPPDRPCALELPPQAFPERQAVADKIEDRMALKAKFAPIGLGEFDWEKSTLQVTNGYSYMNLERMDGYCWTAYDAHGKVASRGELHELALAPGATGAIQLEGVKGVRLTIEFLLEDEVIVRQTFVKGK